MYTCSVSTCTCGLLFRQLQLEAWTKREKKSEEEFQQKKEREERKLKEREEREVTMSCDNHM